MTKLKIQKRESINYGTEVMAESDQRIVIQKAIKPIVFTLIEDSGLYCLQAANSYFYQAIVIPNPLLQRFQ